MIYSRYAVVERFVAAEVVAFIGHIHLTPAMDRLAEGIASRLPYAYRWRI